MKQILCFLMVVSTFYSCNFSAQNEILIESNLEGHWLNKEYLDALENNHSPKKVLENLSFYATELLIDKKKGDSIGVFNGQVDFSFLPFKRHGDTLKLKINQSPQTEIVYSIIDKTLTFTDKELNRVFTFIRADSNLIDRTYVPAVAFPTAVNKYTFEGFWEMFEHNSTNKTIQLDKFGLVKGWEKYENYAVCVNGDCVSNQDGDVVFFGNKTKSDQYGFYSKGDTISIYQLQTVTDPDEKPVYKHGQPIALLVRKK